MITSDTADGTVSVSGTGNTRTVTISGITGTGSLGITIGAGTARDAVGNTALGTGESATFIVRPATTFDMKSPGTATVAGWSKVQQTTLYSATTGFGWVIPRASWGRRERGCQRRCPRAQQRE